MNRLRLLALSATLACSLSAQARPSAASDEVTPCSLYGFVNYSEDFEDGYIYRIDMPSTSRQRAAYIGDGIGACGAFTDGKLMRSIYSYEDYDDNVHYCLTTYPTDTWDEPIIQELDATSTRWDCQALTFCPTDPHLGFGLFPADEGEGWVFATIDYDAATRTTLASADRQYVILASYGSQVYGWGDDNCLYTIDPVTCQQTQVCTIDWPYVVDGYFFTQSATIDPVSGVCYWAAIDGDNSDHSGILRLDLTTGETEMLENTHWTQIWGLCIASMAEPKAPAIPTGLAANFEGPSLTGTFTFLMPQRTYDQTEALTGELSYTVTLGGDELATGTAAPGETVTLDITAYEGWNYFTVTVANAVGTSPENSLEIYAGYDIPNDPEDIQLTIDDAGVVTLTWEAPTEGSCGGYMGALTYNVYRIEAGDYLLVSEAQSATTFSETLTIDQLTPIQYAVEAINGSNTSGRTASEVVVAGGAYRVPFTASLSDESIFNLFTVIDANEDWTTWEYEFWPGYAKYSYDSDNAADDWLISPNVELKAGKKYILSCRAASGSSNFTERLELKLGEGTTAEAMTQSVIAPYEPAYCDEELADEIEPVEAEFEVTADGLYNIGIHCISDADMLGVSLYSISVTEAPAPTAPAEVSSLTITPGEKGALEATLAFDAPTLRRNGEALTAIDAISIVRGGETVHTFEHPVPGEHLTYTDSDIFGNGFQTWSIVASNEDGDGTKLKERAYVGIDTPGDIAWIKATDNGTSVDVEWAPVGTVGIHGGYVDPEGLTYTVYMSSFYDIYEGSATAITLDVNTDEGDPDVMYFSVSASNEAGYGSFADTEAFPVGEPLEMPFTDGFDGEESHYWWTECSDYNEWSSSWDEGADGREGVAYWTSQHADEQAFLHTQKLVMTNTTNPAIHMAYKADGAGMKLNVLVGTPDGEQLTLTSIDMAAAETDQWHTAALELPASLQGQRYFYVTFEALSSADYVTLWLDDVQIANFYDHDLALTTACPAAVTRGEEVSVALTITNQGLQTATGAMLTLQAGDFTQSQQLSDIAPAASTTFTWAVPTSLFSQEASLSLRAEVTYAADQHLDNNVAESEVRLHNPAVGTVEDLMATATDEGTLLMWSAPASVYDAIEGWEDYDHGTLVHDGEQLGAWMAYDVDQAGTFGWSGDEVDWPGSYQAYSFGIFNPAIAFANFDNVDPSDYAFGSNTALMMDNYDVDSNDDWMISPRLSGAAQTITMMMRELTEQYGAEQVQLLYSTTDRERESFELLESFEVNAETYSEFSFALPEGARYFALRLVSSDIFGLLIDNVAYQGYREAPVGYRIYEQTTPIGETSATEYLVPTRAAGTYSVTALYANGAESLPVTVDVLTGIEAIATLHAGTAAAFSPLGIRVKDDARGIVIIGGKKRVNE